MKQSLISLVIGATMAFGAVAQDEASATSSSALGSVTAGTVATAAVGVGVLAAVVSNNRGSADIADPVDPVDPDPTCNDGDELVDGVCVNTTVSVTDTVTVSGTQTITVTTPITVVSTYLPTVQ